MLTFLKKYKNTSYYSYITAVSVRSGSLNYIRFMRFVAGIFVFSLLLIANIAVAQNDTVRIKGSISDSYTRRAVPGVSIINPKSSLTVATDGKGFFETVIHRTDTLFLFLPGYHTTKFSIADSAKKNLYILHLILEPLSMGLSQGVIIRAPKSLEEIEAERKKMGITPKELDRPEMIITSPISALYEMFSGRAKEREKLKGQMKEDERRKIFKELLNYYNENGLIDLPEKNYDAFIDFCNLPVEFLKYNSDYEITKTIVTQYNKYGRQSGLIK